jgi:hypothetical protein
MLHELRTLARGTGPGEAGRLLAGGFGGVFSTEVGTSGETVIVRPFTPGQDAQQAAGRGRLEGSLQGSQTVELLKPAPFMRELTPQQTGKVWELVWLDFPSGSVPQALEAIGETLPARERIFPVVGCWSVEVGFTLDRVYLLIPYKDWGHRHQVQDALRGEAWPPVFSVPATTGGSKLLLPTRASGLA